MPLVDDRGRLFGRINLIDAFVGGLVIAAIPLAYAGYALFRQPQPSLTGIEPSTITPTTTNVTVRGENLRPFLRVSFGQHQGVTFSLSTPTTAEVKVPELPAGKYDLILYDVAREVSRLPNAVTVEAAPLPSAQASMLVAGLVRRARRGVGGRGRQRRRVDGDGRQRREGPRRWQRLAATRDGCRLMTFSVEVPLEASRQQPALLQARCTVADRRCQVGGIDIERLHALSLFTKGGRPLRFVDRRRRRRWPDCRRVGAAARRSRRRMPHPAFARRRSRQGQSAARGIGWRRSARSTPARRTSWRHDVARLGAGWRARRLVAHGARRRLDVRRDGERRPRQHQPGLSLSRSPGPVGAPFIFETDRYVLRAMVMRVDLRRRCGGRIVKPSMIESARERTPSGQ